MRMASWSPHKLIPEIFSTARILTILTPSRRHSWFAKKPSIQSGSNAMNRKPAVMLPVIASLIGCGSIEPRIDVAQGDLVSGDFAAIEYVVEVQNGALDTFRGVELAFEIEQPSGDLLNGEADESVMTEQNGTYRFSPPATPLGTRIVGVWTAKFRALLSFVDRVVTKTRRAHVGHDVRLDVLALVDDNGDVLGESDLIGGCKTIRSGELFEVVVLASNPSFTSIPDASISVTVAAGASATADPGAMTETISLPAETVVSTDVHFGLFTVNLDQGAGPAAVSLLASVLSNEFDFDPANDVIAPDQSPVTGNPACFDDQSQQFDPETCQVCLVVTPAG